MTNEQKEKLNQLRDAGYGYMRIANELGVSSSTVKSFCRRSERPQMEKPKRAACAFCGKPIDTSARSSRRFCSDACRTKWWNAHANEALPYSIVCAGCGKTVHTSRRINRKYCSHECYIKDRFAGGDSHD